ncbi:MAG: glycosyltransferase [Rickettsiales bacterium]|jgi:glycosyltransferase involved in cell wall biosynthesis|nr:glycosyltransferase [Rickettsiales bacterium]
MNKKVFLLSENPLARNVAPLVRALSMKKVPAQSVKLGDWFPATTNSVIHCFGFKAGRAARRADCARVITISEEPASNFIAKMRQKSAMKGAKSVATSKYIAGLWGIKSVVFPGLNLDIFNPEAIPARRQTDMLGKYNIPHDKKMIVCSSPALPSLPIIIEAVQLLDREDFIIAMLGTASKLSANKMLRQAEALGASGKIIFIGEETDIPSLMKSAFATISVLGHEHVAASIAVGTPTIAVNTEFASELAVNYLVAEDDPGAMAEAIDSALDLDEVEIEKITTRNARYAKEYLSINKTADEYIEIYEKL